MGVVSGDTVSDQQLWLQCELRHQDRRQRQAGDSDRGDALGGDAGNYTVSQPSGLTADITAKNLTINGAVANNKQYDGNTTATVDFTGATHGSGGSGDTVSDQLALVTVRASPPRL